MEAHSHIKIVNLFLMRRKKGIMLSLQRLKSPLETVVECPAAKNSPENVISWSRVCPLFRPVSLVSRPTLKSIPFLIIFRSLWQKNDQNFGINLNRTLWVGNFASIEQCHYIFTWISSTSIWPAGSAKWQAPCNGLNA